MTREKVILIGGEGYIGSVIKNYLLKKNFSIISIDNLIYHQKIKKKIKNSFFFNFHKLCISNLKKIKKIFKPCENVNVVILASVVGDPITKKYPYIAKKYNVNFTKKLINFLSKLKLKNIIYVSTCSNYGVIKKNKIANEKTRLTPKSIYAKTKVDVEEYIKKKKFNKSTLITILRFATAFGLSDRMRFDLTINEFVREIYLKKKIDVYDPYTWRPYCHVKDFANIIFRIISMKKIKRYQLEIFNAGSSKNNFNKMMILRKIMKFVKKFKIILKKDSADLRDYKVNFSKIKKVYGFKPSISIDKGIREILEELKKGKYKNLSKYKDKLGNYTIYKNVKKNNSFIH